MLADFHPHGAMVKSYGLFNESNGAPRRAVIIIDKEGIIRFRQEYPAGTLPNVDEILTELDGLQCLLLWIFHEFRCHQEPYAKYLILSGSNVVVTDKTFFIHEVEHLR